MSPDSHMKHFEIKMFKMVKLIKQHQSDCGNLSAANSNVAESNTWTLRGYCALIITCLSGPWLNCHPAGHYSAYSQFQILLQRWYSNRWPAASSAHYYYWAEILCIRFEVFSWNCFDRCQVEALQDQDLESILLIITSY